MTYSQSVMEMSFPAGNFFVCHVCIFFVDMKVERPLIIIMMLLLNCVTLSSKSQTQYSGWFASFNTIKTGIKTSIHAETQWRSTDKIEHLQTAFIRGGLNYNLNKNMIVTAGYGYFHNRRVVNNTTGHATEHRIWQQFLMTHSIKKKVQVAHRFRLEQRFIEKKKVMNNELEKDGFVYANRFRYFIRNVLPLVNEPVFAEGLFVALQNEVFVNFGNLSTVNGKYFDQNRLYLASGYRVNKQWDLELGYMNQYIFGMDNAFTNNHILQIASYLRL